MLIDYLPGDSLLHRLHIRTKVFGFLVVIIWCFLFQNPLYNLCFLLGILVFALQSKISYKKVWQMIRPLMPICLFLLLFTGITYPPERFQREISQVILFSIANEGQVALSVGGFLTGVNYICRLLIMVLGSSILTLTTPLDEFMQFLNQLRVPAEITFMITTALRFIPTLDKKRLFIIEAQRARGARINDKSSMGRIKTYLLIMVPLFVNSILIAEDLAKGMLNRGYGYRSFMTPIRECPLTAKDYWVLWALLLFLGGGLYMRIGLNSGVL
ncbi:MULTISPECIES: energy-coupling factor transporter transmembrane protein EcfT [Desulfitobacterium]|uniref:ABC-type cobalt transport system, permease component CbiQ n=1 Tax=Desulfitobacterium dehalogenans (strain ATCC 51507 / DSM 9161 / JW/IU-DC1) TaxID=756499 RepID=I4ACE0_DESDJ|nr:MULTISPECIES: energy-coupling factor transporter transmembrane component T [Desulfitobacterium]AFM01625.1 ABC-type cobalt transport system, permease component CbiQ [Desulfitobacterium dehalogenans ATCC 51507]